MSRRGPAPKTSEKVAAMGNPGKRALKEAGVKRIPGVPIRPAQLHTYALAFWDRVEKVLRAQGRWSKDIEFSLVALCECYAERESLKEYLEKVGRWEDRETARGDQYTTAHPAVAAYQNADARFLRWLAEFGLTDASRQRVTPSPDSSPASGTEDPAAEFGLPH